MPMMLGMGFEQAPVTPLQHEGCRFVPIARWDGVLSVLPIPIAYGRCPDTLMDRQ